MRIPIEGYRKPIEAHSQCFRKSPNYEEILSKIPLDAIEKHLAERKENITDFYRSQG